MKPEIEVISQAATALDARGGYLTGLAVLLHAAADSFVTSGHWKPEAVSQAARAAKVLAEDVLDFRLEEGEPGDRADPVTPEDPVERMYAEAFASEPVLADPDLSADDRALLAAYYAQRREEEANFERGFLAIARRARVGA
jgi:hypothetical protein